jgi:hypothetical protein
MERKTSKIEKGQIKWDRSRKQTFKNIPCLGI